MRKIYLFVLSGLLMMALVGCSTVRGIGDDVGTVGKWLSKGSDTVKEGAVK